MKLENAVLPNFNSYQKAVLISEMLIGQEIQLGEQNGELQSRPNKYI